MRKLGKAYKQRCIKDVLKVQWKDCAYYDMMGRYVYIYIYIYTKCRSDEKVLSG